MIAYADINDAKAPEALKGKAGYVFKEWNTKEDGSGEAYKPGDSISKLLKSENPAMQNLDSANTNSVVQDKKMGEMESEGLNPTVESAGNTAQILSVEEEKMESASLAEEPEWTEETEESKTAEMVTSETTTGTTITLYAIWEKQQSIKLHINLIREKTARLTPKRILERLK